MAAGRPSGAGSEPESTTGVSDKYGSIHRCGLQALPPREDQAVLEGRQVRLAEMPDRDPPLPAWRARQEPPEGERVPPSGQGEAEGQADLRHPREAVPQLLH